jgi:hypothetical protein
MASDAESTSLDRDLPKERPPRRFRGGQRRVSRVTVTTSVPPLDPTRPEVPAAPVSADADSVAEQVDEA